ncbi:hypothetical protein SUT328_00170 [Streptococcus parasuis]|nr:hypothetical protein SUT328_00170 [Streptococcus parasuis]
MSKKRLKTGLPRQYITLFMIKLGSSCLLYTSDAADDRISVDLGGRRIIKNSKQITNKFKIED